VINAGCYIDKSLRIGKDVATGGTETFTFTFLTESPAALGQQNRARSLDEAAVLRQRRKSMV